jgi:hypothetical protein
MRSFNFLSSGQANFVGADVKTWVSGTETFWAFERNGSSTFSIQGFKNVNIHCIHLIGNIGTQTTPVLGGCIPTDWSATILINGQLPIIGNTIPALNDFNFNASSPNANNFKLGRFNPKVVFESPFQSVTSIQLLSLSANGTGAQTAGNLNLQYFLNFVVYYNFEGE